MKRFAALTIAVLLLAGCGATNLYKGLLVSGDSVKGVGEQFEATAKVYKNGCEVTITISKADCEKFRIFGENFKKIYPTTADLWDTARRAGDAAVEKKTRDVIAQLASELTALGLQAYGAFGGSK